MKNRLNKNWLLVVGICSLFMLTSLAAGSVPQTTNSTAAPTSTDYTGTLRVYIVEPLSRWNMANGQPYHFGFLGFATQTAVDIPYLGTLDHTYTWSGTFTDTNIMAIAAVFNSEGHQAYAYPPSHNPFTAHYSDAAAAATPGTTGYNQVVSGFSHTVFAEEATATWCGYCPSMAQYLDSVYESHDYPFYFAALVDDMNAQAHTRLVSDYNVYGFPTAFFDGGYKVLLGSQSSETPIRNDITLSGARTVPDLNLSVGLTVPSAGNLNIHVVIVNNAVSYNPDTPVAPTGPNSGIVTVPYEFSAITTDPQNDPLYYYFDWGDGTNSGWVGPFNAGVHGTASHAWTTAQTFSVKVKAKDTGSHESGWSPTKTIAISGMTVEITVAATKGVVNATVRNPGTQDYTNLAWSIHVKGGILGRINVSNVGTITSLPAGASTTIQSSKVFGLGAVTISITVAASAVDKQGFALGPFLFIR